MKKEDPNLEEKVFADCADFLGEKSSLMHLGKCLGVDLRLITLQKAKLNSLTRVLNTFRAEGTKCIYRR